MTVGLFAGGSPAYYEVVVGEDVSMECPANTSNDETLWWHENDRLVINGEVRGRLKYKQRISFNRTIGALTVHAATLSDRGAYYCGFAFGKKHLINLTVKSK